MIQQLQSDYQTARTTSLNFKKECVNIRHWQQMFTFLDPRLLSGLGTGKMHFYVHLGRVKIVEHAGNQTLPNLPF